MNHLTYQLLVLTLIAGHCDACNSRSSSRSYNSAPTIVCPSFPAILMTAKGDVTRNISWAVPNAYDDNGTPRFYQSEGLPSGSIFSEGSHTIRYIATDYYGSSGACTVSFRLKVRRCRSDHLSLANGTVHCHDAKAGNVYGSRCQYGCDPGYRLVGSSVAECQENETWTRPKPYCKEKVCRKLPPPENGAVTCHSVNRTSRTCLPQCGQDMVLHDAANRTYTCSDLSEVWSPKDFIPRCMAPRRPQDVMTSPSFYYYSRDCSSDVTVVREKFLTALSGLQLVGADGKCDVREVVVTCGKHVTGWQTAGEHLPQHKVPGEHMSQYKMTATLRMGVYRNQGTPSGSYKFYSSVVESLGERLSKASSAGDLDLPGIGRFGELEQGQVKFTCEPGTRMVYDVMACVGCGQGYIYDTKTDKCKECPKDTYQDQDIGFTCQPCPTGTMTVYMGSVSLNQCQGHCPTGHYSDTGMTPCRKCPAGTYQSERGMHVCDLCPFGMSTPQSGATSGQDCQFVAVKLDENSPGPVLEVKDDSPVTFTFMAWLSAGVNHTRSRLRFSLEHSTVNSSCAGLVLGHVTFCLDTDVTNATSVWSHVAVVYTKKGELIMYENGNLVGSYLEEIKTSNNMAIKFKSSAHLKSVLVSGLQMTRTEYTDVHVGTFARSCLAQVDDNILGARPGVVLKAAPGSCTVPDLQGWMKWGLWSPCDVTCGQGTRSRSRKCRIAHPEKGGGRCPGVGQEAEVCHAPPCVI